MKRQTNSRSFARKALQRCQPVVFAFFATVLSLPANAGITLPTDPLQSSGRIAPNILFILDDSGSMTFKTMPEDPPSTSNVDVADQAYTRNTIYYNPAVAYQPWVDAAGAPGSGGTTYAAAYANLNYASNPINLSNSSSCATVHGNQQASANPNTTVCGGTQTFYVPKDPSNTTSAYLGNGANYYRFQIHADLAVVRSEPLNNVNNQRGLDNRNCSNSSSGWQWKNCVEATPTGRSAADERINYATWFSYYRTRMKTAKAGAGSAFSGLGKNVRVGFRTIWGAGRNISGNPMTYANPILVNRNDGIFDDPEGAAGSNNNRTTWFNRLYGAYGYNGTPLHSALQAAGTYYESNESTGPYGPQASNTQFACRQNFSILTTDGYWNDTGNGYTSVGEQDNSTGSAITNEVGDSYAYSAVAPYKSADSNTLADVAMRYWKSDLRDDLKNVVPTSTDNPAFWQHMVTFGISIGLQGNIKPTDPLPGLPGGAAGWPNPNDAENEDRIDDLYHAAVNGRGKFLAASKPEEFADGLKAALATIVERTGSFANLAANSTQLGTGTQVFQASYVSGIWTGQLKSFPVTSTGVSDIASWSASAGIPTSGRKIFTLNGTSGAIFPTAAQTTALARTGANTPVVTGANNAAYLAGARNLELANGGTLRNRNHLLGDIVDSSPAYDSLTNVVYAGANDGMLHAFDAADSGKELFAYVPAGINFTDLATLSKPDYAHRYFVDGPLVLSTRNQTPAQSILVGTLGRGGKGLYVLDVTTPGSFGTTSVKWERTSTPLNNMGQVLGQPIITKLNNGDMGLIVPNGINSQNDRAALLVYKLDTGQLLAEIDTGVGTALLPNGLSAPTVRDADNNGTVDFVYAGDLQGNLWKFDLSSANPTNWSDAANRLKMFSAVNAGGQVQPITSAPTIARDPSTFKVWVFFGTGRFMTVDDLANKQIQSLYGIQDGTTTITSRATQLQERKIIVAGTVNGSGVRGFEAPSALNASARGWYIDLVDPPNPPGTILGERIVSGTQVVATVLITSSIIPSADPCLPGGTGYLNALDAFTGSSLSSSFFDLNADNNFDDEVIAIGTGPGQVLIPVGSIALGGLGTEGTLFGGGGGGGGLICLNISDASIECERIRELRKVGRVSWREVVRDDQ